ncbi:type 1 glutamine amidotransferase [Pyrococcus furiosus DSM 3638]|uniref:anthranilate synthase n=3 Tax=Pyrococcus furiosus TaxID=2261 RepID=Q8U091_PYRFU|nr:aminodeoxychorismate/anthranilate synthase component II [Pyrococcus furiosus]AAL81832.1 anthranilate synthase component II [Pyrococcus furiosus DSM 3638]AFN04932.1 anthranilate synthase component II [Pyrococcus furiosus COM1]QEK79325.1 type 1 glutamine amidotransferase [Pyrococcus furiosus DSM 3638]
MILIINNRDSFVWNLAEYVSFFDEAVVVSNKITLSEVKKLDPDGIIISPGPGHPLDRREVGNSPEIVLESEVPLLGVCLGHQIIGAVFGGKIGRVTPKHGKASLIRHDGKGVYRGLDNPFLAGRYHSLAVLEPPKGFKVTSVSLDDGVIMGIRHKTLPIEGVQFHPESVLTKREDGLRIIQNFVEMTR